MTVGARGTRRVGRGWAKGDRRGQSVIEVRQVVFDGVDEAWVRVTGDWDVRGVEAGRIDFAGGWNVTVSVMEFVREDPLESELRPRIAAALRSVGGVETAEEMDREVWFVTGTPSSDALRWMITGKKRVDQRSRQAAARLPAARPSGVLPG